MGTYVCLGLLKYIRFGKLFFWAPDSYRHRLVNAWTTEICAKLDRRATRTLWTTPSWTWLATHRSCTWPTLPKTTISTATCVTLTDSKRDLLVKGLLQNSNHQNSSTHNSKLINWDQLRNRMIRYSIIQNIIGNVKLLSISIDNIYCQFKINKI